MAKKLIESTPKCSNWNLRATTINTCDNIQARVKIYFRGNNWDLDAISLRKLTTNQPPTHPHESCNKLSVLWKHWRYTKANLTIKHKKLYVRDYLQVEDSSSSKTIMPTWRKFSQICKRNDYQNWRRERLSVNLSQTGKMNLFGLASWNSILHLHNEHTKFQSSFIAFQANFVTHKDPSLPFCTKKPVRYPPYVLF